MQIRGLKETICLVFLTEFSVPQMQSDTANEKLQNTSATKLLLA